MLIAFVLPEEIIERANFPPRHASDPFHIMTQDAHRTRR